MQQVLEKRQTENLKKAYSMLYNDYIHGYINVEEYKRYCSLLHHKQEEIEQEKLDRVTE